MWFADKAEKTFNAMVRATKTTNKMNCVVGEESLRLFVFHASVNDHVLTLLPVDRSCDTVLVSELYSINDTDNFVLIEKVSWLKEDLNSRHTKLRPITAG